eukprot:PRCOL_00001120-RA
MGERPADFEARLWPQWESIVYPDGTRYEGLTKEGLCHVRGVMTYGDTGETYAGEFGENSMNGLGEYRWSDGSLYQGQWKDNNQHGCGVKVYPRPGEEPDVEAGEWIYDVYVGDANQCSVQEAFETAAEARYLAERARLFQGKPDGQSMMEEMDKRDAAGNLTRSAAQEIMMTQSGLHYPEGTQYLAPGPVGDAYAVPEATAENTLGGYATPARRARLSLSMGEAQQRWGAAAGRMVQRAGRHGRAALGRARRAMQARRQQQQQQGGARGAAPPVASLSMALPLPSRR